MPRHCAGETNDKCASIACESSTMRPRVGRSGNDHGRARNTRETTRIDRDRGRAPPTRAGRLAFTGEWCGGCRAKQPWLLSGVTGACVTLGRIHLGHIGRSTWGRMKRPRPQGDKSRSLDVATGGILILVP